MTPGALLALAGNERRRAAGLAPGLYRTDAIGWARDLVATARRRRLERKA